MNIAEQALAELARRDRGALRRRVRARPNRAGIRKKQRGAQEAHEAIRPTTPPAHPDRLQNVLTATRCRLYA